MTTGTMFISEFPGERGTAREPDRMQGGREASEVMLQEKLYSNQQYV